MELLEFEGELQSLGIGIAAMTYDSNEDAHKFSRQFGIEFPILQDVDQFHVRRFDILNKDHSPGHWAFGVPHPGILLIDRKGILRFKLAEEGYRERPAWSEVLEAARELDQMDP